MSHTPSLHRLTTLIAAHERYWAGIAQRHPHSPIVRAWLSQRWDPYYRHWMGLALDGGLAGNTQTISDLMAELNRLRADALVSGMPLPPELGEQPLVGAASAKLLEIAHNVAPATIVELTTEMSGPVLVVRACINGKCYEGAADMTHVIAELRAAGVDYHAELHRNAGAPLHSDTHPLVGASVEALVGSLLDQHHNETIGGWWHGLTHGIEGAAKGIAHGAQGTLKVLGPEITMAATMAATSLLGPEAGPYAAKLTGALVSAANGQGGAAAKQVLSAAESLAQTNPQAAKALAVAKSTVAKATAAYHVAQTVSQAAQGNPQAQQQVAELTKAAVDGDPAAAAAMQTVTNTYDQATGAGDGSDAAVNGEFDFSRHHHKHRHPHASASVTPRVGNMAVTEATIARQRQAELDAYYAANGAPADTFGQVADYVRSHVVGVAATVNSARDRGMTAATSAPRAAAYVYVETQNGAALSPMSSLDDAADRYGALDKHAITYAAFFDPNDPTWPEPISDEVGEVVRASVPAGTIPRGVVRVSGSRVCGDPSVGAWPALVLAALAGGAAGRFGGQGIDWLRNEWNAHHKAA